MVVGAAPTANTRSKLATRTTASREQQVDSMVTPANECGKKVVMSGCSPARLNCNGERRKPCLQTVSTTTHRSGSWRAPSQPRWVVTSFAQSHWPYILRYFAPSPLREVNTLNYSTDVPKPLNQRICKRAALLQITSVLFTCSKLFLLCDH